MIKRIFSLLIVIPSFITISEVVLVAQPFYEGKVVRVIVGYSPGGGFDVNARMISRHLGKHIPGHPTVMVENMPGAGGLISANHLYKVAKPDGLTFTHFNGGLFFNQLFGQPGVEFDTRKFEFVGAPMKEYSVVALTKASGITSIEKWMASKTPVKLGGLAPGNFIDNNIKILKAALGLPIQLVSGYKGTGDIRLAAESGEIAGGTWAWNTLKVIWRSALETGDAVAVLQEIPQPLPDLPNVPLAISLAKTEEARQLIEIGIHSPSIFNRPFVLPPGTPKDRVQILRKAFLETMKDKEFLAENEKSKLEMDPVSGEDLERVVNGIFKSDPALLAKLKDIFFK